MRCGAVDQSRIQRADAPRVTEHQGGAAAGAGNAEQDARRVFCRAGNRHADRVEQRQARGVEGLAGNGGELDGESLVGVGESLLAASNLLRTLKAGSAAAEEAAERYSGAASGSAGLQVLPSLFDAIPEQAALRLAIAEWKRPGVSATPQNLSLVLMRAERAIDDAKYGRGA